jgi:hypothetical protein
MPIQVEQLRGSVLGEQLGQRAEGSGVRRVAPTAVKARACERNIAERGAEDDRILSLAAQAAGGAAAMPVDVGRRLGFDHGVLEPSEQILGVLQAHVSSRSPLLSSCRITSSRITVSSSLMMRS